ncbi:MAG: hypothetical protein HRT72_11250 [Flavobacteriales bacterium]|nr:hypothetical protein [Flavobacteriales bacterium]
MKKIGKISLDRCKSLLNRGSDNYSLEELRKIRDFLYFIARIDIQLFYKKMQNKVEQKSIQIDNDIEYGQAS